MKWFAWENDARRLVSLTVGNSFHGVGVGMWFVLRTSTFKHCRLLDRPFPVPSDMCTQKRLWLHDALSNTSQPTNHLTKSNKKPPSLEAISSSAS